MTAKLDKDLDTESSIRERQADINHLKFMLHQKELELSLLKEQIEKEKLALSDLQTKAEAEISRAQKLISEKDAELQATEGSLSGLEERILFLKTRDLKVLALVLLRVQSLLMIFEASSVQTRN
ncbi:hypothetical protein ACJW30_11G133000 [Castanea mollissima]